MNAKAVVSLLLRKYPDAQIALRFSNPLELLVATILSAQSTDARVNEVTQTLFKKYRSARAYAQADLATFEQEIRSTGFYRNKAKTVIACCQELEQRFHGKVPTDADELTGLPGVGRKTANMVLGNAYGIPGIAVDTHVARVSNRIGMAHSQKPEKIEEELMQQVPRPRWTTFTNAMILHGRETCTAKAPRCCACVVYNECEWEQKLQC